MVTPIVKLEKVDVTTGEEEDAVVWEARAKLFAWGEGNEGMQWKERGVGPVRILRGANDFCRVLMRRDNTLKVIANHFITDGMVLENKLGTDRAINYYAPGDFSDHGAGDPEVKAVHLAFRFKNADIAAEFRTGFEHCRDGNAELVKKGGSPSKPRPPVGAAPQDDTAAPSQDALKAQGMEPDADE